MYKKIVPYINCEHEVVANIINEASGYEYGGADEIYVFNYSKDEATITEFLGTVKELTRQIDIPIYIGCYANRFEDVKKAFYTGATYVVIKYSLLGEINIVKEASDRFGKDKIILELDNYKDALSESFLTTLIELGVYAILIKHLEITGDLLDHLNHIKMPVLIRDSLSSNDITALIKPDKVVGLSTNYFKDKDLRKAKISLKEQGINVNTFASSIDFSEFKLNSDVMIPVVVQDYKSNEVLMLAYMNEEAFQKTVSTGRMTYYSRSRQSLWTKGETSGHYQYVKSLMLDCDNDTILAKVRQIGPACHTGSQSCFFQNLVNKEYNDTNPLTVFTEVFNVILDRKQNPKEGSYTNYLFDKGIDKILKKCGEEATEIVIAAKNPEAEELKYEISDFLYHMMVLMAECNLDWDDIVKELSHRK
ncbi:MAG: phosphoribosyl-ATP diphosphatase [Lachnospiraceae bacterium]|jgi:phosphoribosyl-ATP pyrophosphohydrolase/phosphoribosyl-AMP cyclohydrolase|nr:phosphoribosyl-ATP diphosphatase [Lachnospiraceae bacterium]